MVLFSLLSSISIPTAQGCHLPQGQHRDSPGYCPGRDEDQTAKALELELISDL